MQSSACQPQALTKVSIWARIMPCVLTTPLGLLVVPLVNADGALVGVFDLDSPLHARFSVEDQHGLEAIAKAFLESLQ